MWFCEEVGELTRALRRGHIDELEGEFADVFAWLSTLASIADIAMADVFRAADRFDRLAELPACRAYLARATARPAFQKALADQMAQLQLMEQYEAALEQLGETQREAVMLRVEFGFSYAEIAQALDIPSANAARMCVCRALEKLAALM